MLNMPNINEDNTICIFTYVKSTITENLAENLMSNVCCNVQYMSFHISFRFWLCIIKVFDNARHLYNRPLPSLHYWPTKSRLLHDLHLPCV